MTKSVKGKGAYSLAFVRLFSFLVKIGNNFNKLGLRFGLRRMSRNPGIISGWEAIDKFTELIPEMKYYNQSDALYQIRLRTLANGYYDLGKWLERVSSNPEDLRELRENLTFVGSHFFRGEVWPTLRQQLESMLSGNDKERINVWCAGCSNGKEVYSVLMLLSDLVPLDKVSLLATDYNREMLRQCEAGVYSLRTIDEIPLKYWPFTEKYNEGRGTKKEFSHLFQFRFVSRLRDLIQTRYVNLLTGDYPQGFDLVFCRNVIKFFENDSKRKVQERLAASVNPGGIIVVSDEIEREGFPDPESLGLTQVDNSCVYIKSAVLL